MRLSEAKGDWALVTGASSGIGREFAVQLARAGMNVVLVARRKDLLEALALSLNQNFGVKTRIVVADLTQNGRVAELKAHLATEGLKVRVLCNNAAFGRWGRFESTPIEVYQQMIELNTTAIVSMCHHFFPDLSSFPTSVVINVSSPAALQPVPYMTVYAATKAFIHSFSQALYGEWKERGILVQTLLPSPTETEFDTLAGAYESALKGRGKPEQVVKDSLKHLAQEDPVVSNSKGTYKQRIFAGLFPSSVVIREVGKMFKPPR